MKKKRTDKHSTLRHRSCVTHTTSSQTISPTGHPCPLCPCVTRTSPWRTRSATRSSWSVISVSVPGRTSSFRGFNILDVCSFLVFEFSPNISSFLFDPVLNAPFVLLGPRDCTPLISWILVKPSPCTFH